MPSKLRVISAKELVSFLEKNGFSLHSIKGSHAKLRRHSDNHTQTLIIPMHKTIAKGTLRSIYNQIIEFLPEAQVRGFFFTE